MQPANSSAHRKKNADWDQLIRDVMRKVAQTIAVMRVSPLEAPSNRPQAKEYEGFQLQIGTLPDVDVDFEQCYAQSKSRLVINIVAVFDDGEEQLPLSPGARLLHSSSSLPPDHRQVLLETWTLTFEPAEMHQVAGTVKKMYILLRTLVTYLGILPCDRLVRERRNNSARPYVLRYSMSPEPRRMLFDVDTRSYEFSKIETEIGCLGLSVTYRGDCKSLIELSPASSASITRYPNVNFVENYVHPGSRPVDFQRPDVPTRPPVLSTSAPTHAGLSSSAGHVPARSPPGPPLDLTRLVSNTSTASDGTSASGRRNSVSDCRPLTDRPRSTSYRIALSESPPSQFPAVIHSAPTAAGRPTTATTATAATLPQDVPRAHEPRSGLTAALSSTAARATSSHPASAGVGGGGGGGGGTAAILPSGTPPFYSGTPPSGRAASSTTSTTTGSHPTTSTTTGSLHHHHCHHPQLRPLSMDGDGVRAAAAAAAAAAGGGGGGSAGSANLSTTPTMLTAGLNQFYSTSAPGRTNGLYQYHNTFSSSPYSSNNASVAGASFSPALGAHALLRKAGSAGNNPPSAGHSSESGTAAGPLFPIQPGFQRIGSTGSDPIAIRQTSPHHRRVGSGSSTHSLSPSGRQNTFEPFILTPTSVHLSQHFAASSSRQPSLHVTKPAVAQTVKPKVYLGLASARLPKHHQHHSVHHHNHSVDSEGDSHHHHHHSPGGGGGGSGVQQSGAPATPGTSALHCTSTLMLSDPPPPVFGVDEAVCTTQEAVGAFVRECRRRPTVLFDEHQTVEALLAEFDTASAFHSTFLRS